MPSYKITMEGVEATNATQAEKVKKSLVTILNILKSEGVIDLATLLEEKPGIVEKAKQYSKFF